MLLPLPRLVIRHTKPLHRRDNIMAGVVRCRGYAKAGSWIWDLASGCLGIPCSIGFGIVGRCNIEEINFGEADLTWCMGC
jgi:hypothetical protein